jgi:quinol monooxygenase YgiN
MADTHLRDIEGLQIADAPVVELRRYTLKPGARDTLIEIFEDHLVETQEATGMRLGGLFRDRDDPDRFVWMRAFASLEARRAALTAFYGGPVWKTHGPAANATMVDSDDVLLLRPTDPAHPALPPRTPRRPRTAAPDCERVLVTAYVHDPDKDLESWLARDVHPVIEAALGTRVGTWRTEPGPNTYPALPVRPDHAFVWTATFVDDTARLAGIARLETSPAWAAMRPVLASRVRSREVMQLQPTARSQHPRAGLAV